jgi:hypothetical protein
MEPHIKLIPINVRLFFQFKIDYKITHIWTGGINELVRKYKIYFYFSINVNKSKICDFYWKKLKIKIDYV